MYAGLPYVTQKTLEAIVKVPEIYYLHGNQIEGTINNSENLLRPLPPVVTQGIGTSTNSLVDRVESDFAELSYLDPKTGKMKTEEQLDREYTIDPKEFTGRMNTVLEERSYLDFYFPNSLLGRRRVVFFENPDITETRQPRYAKKNIVARNEPVRMWVGSEPRRVKIKFNYTLPHIAQFWAMTVKKVLQGFGPADGFNWDSFERTGAYGKLVDRGSTNPIRDTPALDPDGVDSAIESENLWQKSIQEQIGDFFGDKFKVTTSPNITVENSSNTGGPRWYKADEEPFTEHVNRAEWIMPACGFMETIVKSGWAYEAIRGKPQSTYAMAAYYTMFAIDTVRASVVGDTLALGPVGPPIVRFRHGTIFNESPFIVKNFTIDYNTNFGYEVKTLCPRKITFSLDLEEFRQTFGTQHGNIKGSVLGAGQIIDLVLDSERGTNPDRMRTRTTL